MWLWALLGLLAGHAPAQPYFYFDTDAFVVYEGGGVSGTLRRSAAISPHNVCILIYTNVGGVTPIQVGADLTGYVTGGTCYQPPNNVLLAQFGSDALAANFSFGTVNHGGVQPEKGFLLYMGAGWAPPAPGTNYIQAAWALIQDNDAPATVSAYQPAALEGGTNYFIFERSTNNWRAPMTIRFTLSGSATPGTDYQISAPAPFTLVTGATNQFTLPAWYNSGYVTVSLSRDAVAEGNETITARIEPHAAQYAMPATNTATMEVRDDYATVSIEATDDYAAEAGLDTGLFTVTRVGNTNQAITVQLLIGGTAVAGVDYVAIPTNITLAAGVLSSNLTVTPITNAVVEAAETVVVGLITNAAYVLGLHTNAVVTIAGESAHPRDSLPRGERYTRGAGTNLNWHSIVVPLDGIKGTRRSEWETNPSHSQYSTRYHYNATNASDQAYATNRITYNTPIASFGGGWGTPLYLGQSYALGIHQGTPTSDPLIIYAFRRADGGLEGYTFLNPPDFGDAADWANFATNGFARAVTNHGLTTVLRDAASLTWGNQLGGYLVTHTAADTATNYYYLIAAVGTMNGQWVTVDAANAGTHSYLYELTFEPRPGWRSVFLGQPHFQTEPLPPHLWAKTPEELLYYGALITNAVALTPADCLTLDHSPELRRHPLLDQFVADLNNDPLALANYVQNEIELTDAMAYRDDGSVATESVNPGGVNRGALGVYQEGQGSPIEQCALLVYLLRQAGHPAAYVFPPEGGLKLLDTRLSALLRMRINDGLDDQGRRYTTNRLIPVNYPWVATCVSNQWVHLFPWIKDTAVEEGLDIHDYLPDPYQDTQLWVKDYILGKTNLLAFGTPADDTPGAIFPRFLDHALKQNAPGISVEDIGMRYRNRRHLYAQWPEFPRPTWVTNTSAAVESLTAAGLTQVSPRLTNLFDTVQVELFSVSNPQKRIATSELPMADFHNRKFYLTHTNAGGGQVQAILTLGAYRPNAPGQGNFSAEDTALTNKQVLTLTLDGTDDDLKLRLRHRRQKALTWDVALDPDRAFLDLTAVREVLQERPLRKGDVAAICLNAGRVTPAMLRVHAQELWNMERQLSTNAGAASAIPAEVYQGSLLYLAGMSYYERAARFDAVNRRLFKAQNLSAFAMGLAKISPRRNPDGTLYGGAVDPVWPNVDMFFREVVAVGNGTTRLDSGRARAVATRNYFNLSIADLSAQEHATLNVFFGESNAVSTVKLLQLAQSKVGSGGSNVVELHHHNYVSEGSKVYNGKALKDHDPALWAQVKEQFERAGTQGYGVAWLSPGSLTTSNFSGMGALILGVERFAALIGNNQYGAYASPLPYQTVGTSSLVNWTTRELANGDFQQSFFTPTPSAWESASASTPTYKQLSEYQLLTSGALLADPYQSTWGAMSSLLYYETAGSYLSAYAPMADLGAPFNPDYREGNGFWNTVADPVNTLSGEFYADEVDLSLPGPMPLQLRRNYGSQELGDHQLGYGWKLNHMPYLVVAPSNDVIYAAEPSGSVLAFGLLSANLWSPTPALNPTLNNYTENGIGSLANAFSARLVKTTVGATNYYYLTNADGAVRVFQEMSFPLTNSPAWDRQRPYLTFWQDNRGNFHRFEYGTNATAADYGQVRRVVGGNGNVLRFEYDPQGRVVEAFSLDGRRVQYDYDRHGDLVSVTRPDGSQLHYEYQLATWTTNSVTNVYSTHLLTGEIKPDGRVLKNEYDDQRRVTNQWATVGPDLRLVRNATFRYTNDFTLTTITGTVSGTTTVLDYTNNATTYFYTNGLIRRVRDPLGAEQAQTWYEATETNAPAYPRSLKTVTDKRGLVTSYFYDSRGNVTNTTVKGDLLGDGNTNTTAVSTALYNTDNLPMKTVDASGTTNLFFYTNRWLPARVEIWPGTATPAQAITNRYEYANVTNPADGTASYGLRVREIRAAGSAHAAANDWAYNARGFPTRQTRYTGTGDPAVIVTNFPNYRGELSQQLDAAGRVTRFSFDPLGRPQSREVFEPGQDAPVAWDFSYYNENGELTWTDGPRFDPEDYVWRDYDGAGRPTQEIRWRSRARSDGSGVEAETGDNLYALTFHEYDPYGNVTRTIDPRGAYRTNGWDALGRLVQRSFFNADGSRLSTEGFAYEPGGQIRYHTNALGGLTERQYTATGQLRFQRNPDGSTNAWRYYADDRVHREFQRNGAYWESTYDDAYRKTTRVFHSAAGTPLATNITELDRRGNVIKRIDAGGFAFTNRFDGLDRLKIAAGPPVVTVKEDCGFTPGCGVFVTNIVQQAVTNFYDAAGVWQTNVNALGEQTITRFDALGRVVRTEIRAANGTLVRETSTAYAPDHHSVTVTNGSGGSAIVAATHTDNDGQPVLEVAYPLATVREFTLREYDRAGLFVFAARYAATNSAASPAFHFELHDYDGLGRRVETWDRDFAVTTFAYDALGNVTNRTMPGGLQWQARYNNAGQMLQEWNAGSGGAGTRTNTYAYFTAGHPFAGLLQERTDGRGVTCTHSYDDWLRLSASAYVGPLNYDDLTTTFTYDPRGLLTIINDEPTEVVSINDYIVIRNFDAYGQPTSELVGVGSEHYQSSQKWDAAGRRTALSLGPGYNFGWRADGLLAAVSTSAGSASYGYNTAGVLTNRMVGTRSTAVNSLDGAGRPLSIITKAGLATKLTETLAWTGDGLLSAHTLAREDFTDARQYFYGDFTRRLDQERLNLDGSKRWTNTFTFDNGQAYGPGVLTKVAAPAAGTADWAGATDAFLRINTETNANIRRTAYGRFNGPAAITAFLDGRPQPLSTHLGNDAQWVMRWRSSLELSPGTHQLTVSAAHPSGQFVTNASVWFTNSAAGELVTATFDGAGQLTQRLWRSPGGATNRTQTLEWDVKGRLWRVLDLDAQQDGFGWVAQYDPLNRRGGVLCYAITNGTYVAAPGPAVYQYYDPLVEFLELAVSVNGQTTWKLYGPDLNGVYGGMNGVGGLEGTVTGVGQFQPTISDARGNVLGAVTNGITVAWTAARPTGYGAVPGYRSLPYGHGGDVVTSSAWRGRWVDITGLINLGARYYDPESGRFLSSDPVWNGRDPNYYTFAGGDPVNYFDADGRLAKAAYNNYALPHLQSSYDWLVDRNGTPGTYNNLANFALGGTPSWLGINTAPQDIYYAGNDRYTQNLIGANDFQNGRFALPAVIDQVSGGANSGNFYVTMQGTPWHRTIQDIAGLATHGLIGNYPDVAYTGSWGGTWAVSGQNTGGTTINFSGSNPTTAESMTRVPPVIADWGYNQSLPTLVQNIQSGNVVQNPVQNFQWNGWIQLPTVTLQSPVVPFRSVVSENPFGVNGPFRSISTHYDFQYTAPNP
jgi:RHS repeat-associated protein